MRVETDPKNRRNNTIGIESDESIRIIIEETWDKLALDGDLVVVENIEGARGKINEKTAVVIIDVSDIFQQALEFIGELQLKEGTKHIHVLALSNFHGPEHIDPLTALGVNVLKKPFNLDELEQSFSMLYSSEGE